MTRNESSDKSPTRRWNLPSCLGVVLGMIFLTPAATAVETNPPPALTNTDSPQSALIEVYSPELLVPKVARNFPSEDPPDPQEQRPDSGFDSRNYLRLLGLHSYEGDRQIFQETRRSDLWRIEPRVEYDWRYDSNIFQTPANHVADWYQSLGAGLHFNLGQMDGRPEDLDTIFAVETDYGFSQDWFFDHPNLDALSQKGRIDLRIGRDRLIIRPYFQGSHLTGTQILQSELSGRYTSTNLDSGVVIEQKLTPVVKQTLDCSWGQIDQQSDENVGYKLWKVYDELSYDLISNQVRPQDHRYTTESSAFAWLSAQNASANNRSGDVHYLLGGVGYRTELFAQLTFSTKMGWENIQREWDTAVGRDLSSFCLEAKLRYDYNRSMALEVFWNRGYQLSQTAVDDNYLDNYLALAPLFKFAPGWSVSPAFTVGTTSSEQDEKTFYYSPSTELGYQFSNQTKLRMKVEYDETRALGSTGEDIIGWKSTFSFSLNF